MSLQKFIQVDLDDRTPTCRAMYGWLFTRKIGNEQQHCFDHRTTIHGLDILPYIAIYIIYDPQQAFVAFESNVFFLKARVFERGTSNLPLAEPRVPVFLAGPSDGGIASMT